MMNGGGNGATSDKAAGTGKGLSSSPPSGCLKKGPWTAAEDAILMEYVRKHGEGNWNAVQKNTGMMRCGKSCRLRWANHLRPNLRKGTFSSEEERIIIELHAKLGNKWARMAAQLPGRTDNEIKNYWNTRMKRRQRAGLPLYPQDIQEEAAAFQLEQEQEQQQQNKRHHSSSTSSPLTSLLLSSSSQPRKPTFINPSLSLFNNSFSFSPSTNSLQLNNRPTSLFSDHQFKLFGDSNNNNINGNNNSVGSPYVKPLSSPLSPFSSSSSSSLYNNQNLVAPASMNPSPTTLHQFNTSATSPPSLSQFNASAASPTSLHQFNASASSPPSLHQFNASTASPTSLHQFNSSAASFDPSFMSFSSLLNMGASPVLKLDNPFVPPGSTSDTNHGDLENNNSGLLDALLHESQALSSRNVNEENNMVVIDDKGKVVMVDSSADDNEEEGEGEHVQSKLEDDGDGNAGIQWEDLSSSHSSTVMKQSDDQEPPEVMNSMEDDDLQSLLTNFPSAMPPVPDWYPRTDHGEISNGSSSSNAAGSGNNEAGMINSDKQNASPGPPPPPPVATTNSGSFNMGWRPMNPWNNMPHMS